MRITLGHVHTRWRSERTGSMGQLIEAQATVLASCRRFLASVVQLNIFGGMSERGVVPPIAHSGVSANWNWRHIRDHIHRREGCIVKPLLRMGRIHRRILARAHTLLRRRGSRGLDECPRSESTCVCVHCSRGAHESGDQACSCVTDGHGSE